MVPIVLFGIQFTFCLVAYSLFAWWYGVPRLSRLPREAALVPLVWIHVFRMVGGTILAPGSVDAAVPAEFRTMIGFGDMATALLALLALIALRRRLPSLMAAELFFEAGLRLVLDHTAAAHPFAAPAGAYLLVEAAATSDPTDDLAAVLERAPGEALLAADQSGRARLWQLRERHTEAISAAGIVHKLDVSLPLDRLAAFVARLAPTIEAVAPGARVVCYGHLADGNLHVNILGPAAGDESADGPVLRLVIELGGSISGEHGIGIAKAGWLLADRRAADVAAMRAVKRALDPMGILNPGVLFEA